MAGLTFLGAARTVTGSKYLLEHEGVRVLVDCGLFQGLKSLRERNWEEFPVPPASISAVILTHAHLDHVGYLPRLVAGGFAGRAFCTAGTNELCRLILLDSGRIQEEDARQANKHHYTKHAEALPLYDEVAAQRALTHLQPVSYVREFEVAPGITAEFHPSGHLLGSAFVRVRLRGSKTILFGGDLGRYDRPVLQDPAAAPAADVVLVESTYGDRDHQPDDQGEGLAAIIRDTAGRGGKLIMPAFAIGRVEELLYWIKHLEQRARIPVMPVYVDSPMAVEALRFYSQRVSELDPDMQPTQKDVSTFATARYQAVASTQQSKELTASRRSAIVVSSSGMATGGRVLYHLEAALPHPKNTVLFSGYQGEGTRGRQLVEGASEVRIHGRWIPVRAQVARLDSMSAHADRHEIVRWLGTMPQKPERLCFVHGEPGPMDALKTFVQDRLGIAGMTPHHRERLEL